MDFQTLDQFCDWWKLGLEPLRRYLMVKFWLLITLPVSGLDSLLKATCTSFFSRNSRSNWAFSMDSRNLSLSFFNLSPWYSFFSQSPVHPCQLTFSCLLLWCHEIDSDPLRKHDTFYEVQAPPQWNYRGNMPHRLRCTYCQEWVRDLCLCNEAL